MEACRCCPHFALSAATCTALAQEAAGDQALLRDMEGRQRTGSGRGQAPHSTDNWNFCNKNFVSGHSVELVEFNLFTTTTILEVVPLSSGGMQVWSLWLCSRFIDLSSFLLDLTNSVKKPSLQKYQPRRVWVLLAPELFEDLGFTLTGTGRKSEEIWKDQISATVTLDLCVLHNLEVMRFACSSVIWILYRVSPVQLWKTLATFTCTANSCSNQNIHTKPLILVLLWIWP